MFSIVSLVICARLSLFSGLRYSSATIWRNLQSTHNIPRNYPGQCQENNNQNCEIAQDCSSLSLARKKMTDFLSQKDPAN